MGNDDGPAQDCVAVGELSLDANIVVATSSMSAMDVDRVKGTGSLRMAAADGQAVYLEVGGVVVAAGLIKRKRGTSVFVVTQMMADGQEVRS